MKNSPAKRGCEGGKFSSYLAKASSALSDYRREYGSRCRLDVLSVLVGARVRI